MALPNDYKSTLSIKGLQSPAAITSSGNGTGVDVGDCDQSGTLLLYVGAVSGTSPTLTVKLQESKNNNSADASGGAEAYADISGASVSLTDADANSVITLRVNNRSRRYVRFVKGSVGGSSTPTFNLSAVFVADKKTF